MAGAAVLMLWMCASLEGVPPNSGCGGAGSRPAASEWLFLKNIFFFWIF
jgi:hypothetical protein